MEAAELWRNLEEEWNKGNWFIAAWETWIRKGKARTGPVLGYRTVREPHGILITLLL